MKFKLDTKNFNIADGVIFENSNNEMLFNDVKKYLAERDLEISYERLFDFLEVENDRGEKIKIEDYLQQAKMERLESEDFGKNFSDDIIDPESEEGKKILEKSRLSKE